MSLGIGDGGGDVGSCELEGGMDFVDVVVWVAFALELGDDFFVIAGGNLRDGVALEIGDAVGVGEVVYGDILVLV